MEFVFPTFFLIFCAGSLLLFILPQFIFIVRQQEVAYVEFLGKFSRVSGAGLQFKIPILERVAGRLSLRVVQLDTVVETKTKDNVFTTVKVSVQYFIDAKRAYDAFYKLQDPHRQISAFVFDSVRAQVPNLELDQLFVRKDDIAIQLKNDLDEVMSGFGYIIYKSLVTDIDPDQKVKDSMNEINAQQRLKLAAVEKAEAAKIEVVKAAEADAESKRLQGLGVAEQRKAIIDGYKESVKGFQSEISGTNADDVMMLVLMTQYFDTMKDLADKSGAKTIFMDNSAAATGDVLSQMRQAFIQAKQAE